MGGDCLWTGCVPSKALIAAADFAAAARQGAGHGVEASGVAIDFAQVKAHINRAIAQIAPVDSAEAVETTGVTVRQGNAIFTGPDTLNLDGERIDFVQALLAAGAGPAVPPIPGLDQVDYLTSDSIWDLDELPADLVVLGGGTIGCELGQAFARLGSVVTVVEGVERILPNEDPAAAAIVADALRRDGVRLLTGSAVKSVESAGRREPNCCSKAANAWASANCWSPSAGHHGPKIWVWSTPGWTWTAAASSGSTPGCAPATPGSGPRAT